MRSWTVPALALAVVLALPAGVMAHPDELPVSLPIDAHEASAAVAASPASLPIDAHEASAAVAASHDGGPDDHSENMRLVGNLPYAIGSDLAFWGPTAIAGIYGNSPTDNPGGFRIIDISDPSNPRQLGRFECHGPQSDVSVWRKLAFVSVDSPRAGPGCDQTGSGSAWEGVRIVDISDPAQPTQVAAVATDCGSHTHTLLPDPGHTENGRPAPRVLIYVQSYPLGAPTATCNVVSHRKISVVEVPLRNPEAASVISTPDVSPAIGCHDTTVFPTKGIAASACITESQMWDISDPENPEVIAHIYNPLINIHHSTTFDFEAETLVIGDELGGAAVSPGCMTGGEAPLGALWFYDVTDPTAPSEEGWFVIPQNEEPTQICTAHNFNTIPLRSDRDVLVSAWYFNGTTVVDFTDPSNPTQLGYYEPEEPEAEHWSSYWYNGFIYGNSFQTTRGFDVFAIRDPVFRDARRVPYLNPQTQIPPGVRLG